MQQLIIIKKKNSAQFSGQRLSKIIPKTSANSIMTIMINRADSILNKNIENLKFEQYISLCLDAGTTKFRHFIDIVIWSPRTAFSVFIKETAALNANGYAKLAIDCLNDPKLAKIKRKIAAFVGDGLPSQVAGLTPSKPKSFQSLIDDSDLHKIFFSPCYKYRLRNAIKKNLKEKRFLRNTLTRFMNSQSSYGNLKSSKH